MHSSIRRTSYVCWPKYQPTAAQTSCDIKLNNFIFISFIISCIWNEDMTFGSHYDILRSMVFVFCIPYKMYNVYIIMYEIRHSSHACSGFRAFGHTYEILHIIDYIVFLCCSSFLLTESTSDSSYSDFYFSILNWWLFFVCHRCAR